jgi:phospholipase C
MGLAKDFIHRLKRVMGIDPIKHVIVLMFENHSFDQMLGCFKEIYPKLEGVDPNNPGSNKDSTDQVYPQRKCSDPVVSPDPRHELDHVLNQLKDHNAGFVSEYEKEYPDTTHDERQRIMDYFRMDDLPALHELAKHFTICDYWYSSVPGPTWANRFFVHSGTSKGLVAMPVSNLGALVCMRYNQDTIYDRLTKRKINWRVYFHDIPQSMVLTHQRWPKMAWNYSLMDTFFGDVQGPESAFPAYSFIEPAYLKGAQNDDHPPHSTMRAQRLLGQVYNAIRKNDALWNSTLLVVLYDEHGGFYDHIEPPSAVPPDIDHEEYTFDRLGVRVPALLISPWVDQKVVSTRFDHTSLLKYLIDKWSLEPLTERVREATSIAGAILPSPRPSSDMPKSVPVPPLTIKLTAAQLPIGAASDVTARELAEPNNDLQQSLIAFTDYLAQNEMPGEALSRTMAVGPLAKEQLAKERVERFLTQQKAKAIAGGR